MSSFVYFIDQSAVLLTWSQGTAAGVTLPHEVYRHWKGMRRELVNLMNSDFVNDWRRFASGGHQSTHHQQYHAFGGTAGRSPFPNAGNKVKGVGVLLVLKACAAFPEVRQLDDMTLGALANWGEGYCCNGRPDAVRALEAFWYHLQLG